MPWAYRNSAGAWVGFDLDLTRRLARDLGLKRIDLVEGSTAELERWLEDDRLDLVVGGLAGTPGRAARFFASEPYLKAHLALVVRDGSVSRIQDLPNRPWAAPCGWRCWIRLSSLPSCGRNWAACSVGGAPA